MHPGIVQVPGEDLPGHTAGYAAIEVGCSTHLRQRYDGVGGGTATGHTLVRFSELRYQAVLALLDDEIGAASWSLARREGRPRDRRLCAAIDAAARGWISDRAACPSDP